MATNTPSTAPNSIGNNTSTNNFPASVAISPPSPSSTNNHTTTASKIAATLTNVVAISSSSSTAQQQKQNQQQQQQAQQRLSNNILDTYKSPFQTITSPQTSSSSTNPNNTTQSFTGSNIQKTGGGTNNTNNTNVTTINNSNNNNTSSSSSSSSSSSTSSGSSSMMMTPATGSLMGLKPSSAVITPSSQQSKKTGEQKRPMNAFLMFCKRHRSLVREKHPSLENRGITKILGDWWSKLDKGQKSSYTELARQHKEAFMKANPDFKWYKTTDLRPPINRNTGPASPVSLNMASVTDMISNSSRELSINNNNNNVDPNVPVIIGPYVTKNNGDCATVNTTNSVSSSPKQTMNNNVEKNALTMSNNDDRQHGAPKPPKKRYLENSQHMLASSSSNDLQTNNEDAMLTNDTIVPIFFDKVTFDRVIEHALSDNKSSNSTPSSAACNDLVNNLEPPLCGILDQINSQQSTNNPSSSVSNDRNINKMVEDLGGNVIGAADLSIRRKQSIDEPVDFSMNRTYEATNQKIINNLIDRMLSDSRDSTSSLSNNTSQPMDQDPQPNQQQLQQSSSTLTSNGTNSNNHPSCNVHLIAATNNSSFTNKSSLPEFDLEKKLTELPLFELTNGKFEGIDQRQHDGLATLAEAAVAVQQLPPQLPQHQIQHLQQHNPHSINVGKNDSATSLATLAAVAGQTPNSVVPAASFKD